MIAAVASATPSMTPIETMDAPSTVLMRIGKKAMEELGRRVHEQRAEPENPDASRQGAIAIPGGGGRLRRGGLCLSTAGS